MVEPGADRLPLARPCCPGCEPDADPVHEILDIRWCSTHAPSCRGVDDAGLEPDVTWGNTEAGGEDNRRWCALLHERAMGDPARVDPLGDAPAR